MYLLFKTPFCPFPISITSLSFVNLFFIKIIILTPQYRYGLSPLPKMKQLILCKSDYLDFLSGPATPYWLYQHVPAGVGLTIPLECQVGRALGVMHAHLGEKALTSERAMQPNNIQSTRLYLAPVLAILSPAVCPASSKKGKISELLHWQKKQNSVMDVGIGFSHSYLTTLSERIWHRG